MGVRNIVTTLEREVVLESAQSNNISNCSAIESLKY